MLRILVDENIPATQHYLGALGTVTCVNGRTLSPSQLQGIDVLLVRSVTRVDEALLCDSEVKFVGTATSGFDHIDRAYLAARGIGFAHAPGSNANSVVEYVLAAIAAVGEQLENLLAGGVVGIAGYGNIGKALAARLGALGIEYRIYDPWLDQGTIPHASTLSDVLGCDVVSLHTELTTRLPWPSYHLLGQRELQSLRPETLLINASRGPVVSNAALLEALQTGRGPVKTVLDVWEGEPQVNAELLERVALGSAHIAGYSLDGKVLATRMLRDAVCAHLMLPSSSTESPLAQAPLPDIGQELSGASLIRALVHCRYDIRIDDQLLRQIVAHDKPEYDVGKAFDGLRKSYRERRELAGSIVNGSRLQPQQLALVQALGCVVTGAGMCT
ncbi:MAG: 4-phosphoerythronate dehydrogenase [Halioglobus sp.]